MCGIICCIYANVLPHEIGIMKRNLMNRGPDYYGCDHVNLSPVWKSYLAASVLHTQGSNLTKQPILNSMNDVLLWNGDIFDGILISEKSESLSDTEAFFQWLQANNHDVLKLVSLIEGPYSFIYFNGGEQKLWVGRDPLGRHSLLWKLYKDSLLITSVGHNSIDFQEIPAIGIFCFHLSGNSITDMYLYRWSHVERFLTPCGIALPEFLKIEKKTINYFKFLFERNVGENDVEEITHFYETIPCNEDKVAMMDDMLKNSQILNCVNKLIGHLVDSCRKRVTIRKYVCTNCINETDCCNEHTKLGILFSGGLDSTIIAHLASKFVPENEPIDLINVAFSRNGNVDVPDRRTCISSLEELSKLCPRRTWNLVQVDVSEAELAEARKDRLCHLIHPLKTVLDDSLGCALWFSCMGRGHLNDHPYISSAKIILLGNGADEQFGGYTRHRNMLKRNGWHVLDEQLLRETLEMSRRNLGRDDRIACDSGRQPRFPFLDEKLVDYVANLPAWQKCGSTLYGPGLGDKLLLRLVAVKLGLRKCAVYPKRAFQFGCRIANSKEKGNVSCDRL